MPEAKSDKGKVEKREEVCPAIDVHGHYGAYHRKEFPNLINGCMTASASLVARRARDSAITQTIVSPLLGLLPRGKANTVKGNEEAFQWVRRTKGLLQYVIVNPLQPATYQQARTMLETGKCVGIKLHPEEHCYPIREYGREIFKFAADLGTVVLAHSGDENSLPKDFVPFANSFGDMKLILAHLGHGGKSGRPDLQVQAIAKARHRNIYADTSSARSMLSGLIEWAVGEVGAEHLLFGTDTPLYFAGAQRGRIDRAEITVRQKTMILHENARSVFGEKIPRA